MVQFAVSRKGRSGPGHMALAGGLAGSIGMILMPSNAAAQPGEQAPPASSAPAANPALARLANAQRSQHRVGHGTTRAGGIRTALRRVPGASKLWRLVSRTSRTVNPAVPDTSGLQCGGNVCMSVVGSGTYVSNWYTSAHGSPCSTYPVFSDVQPNGNVRRGYGVFFSGCNAADYSSFYLTHPTSTHIASNNTHLCDTWPGVAGRPCVSVHY